MNDYTQNFRYTSDEMRELRALRDEVMKASQEIADLARKMKDTEQRVQQTGTSARAGSVNLSSGLQVYSGGQQTIDIDSEGKFMVGSDINDPFHTSFIIFTQNGTSYNGEDFDEGDILIGNNTTGEINEWWDFSSGRRNFRYGKTVNLYIDTDGSLKAGGGNVALDYLGLILKLLIDTGIVDTVKIRWLVSGIAGSSSVYGDYQVVGGNNIYRWHAITTDGGSPAKTVEILETVGNLARALNIIIDGTIRIAVTDAGIYIGNEATNAMKVGTDGHVTFLGTATYTLDEKGQLSGAKISSPSSKVIQDETENAYYYKDSATTADYLWLNIQFNHDRKLGEVVSPHLHWWQTSATIPNWIIQYRYQKQGAAKTTAWTSLKWTSHAFTYVSGTLNQITDFTDIAPPSGDGISDELQIRIIRDTANASGLFAGVDGLAGDVYVVDFDSHKTCDSLGSNTEYSKT